jgi:CubicO group peptidase (beta-lactamase class C family)
MDSERLVQAMDYLLEQEEFRIHSLSLVRNGYLVLDAYFYPFEVGWKHDLASVTKSWTSTLVGAALQHGFIESLEQPVLGFFPGRSVANRDARKEAMTVEDLLTMRSGLECITSPTWVTLLQMVATPDWVQFSLDRPMAAAPGQSWVYDNSAVHLLQGIIQQTTGMDTLDFARQYLFDPLGISDIAWLADPQGVNSGFGDLRLTPHDAAKLGYLYLRDGVWEGQRLLPEGWVDAATQPADGPQPPDIGCGYLWWLSPDRYAAHGRGGQRIVVVPEQEIVMVVTAGGGLSAPDINELLSSFISSYILPACKSTTPLAANSDAVATLQARVEQAAAVPPFEPLPLPPIPQTAQRVSGRSYALQDNWLAMTHMTLTMYPPDETGVRIITEGGPLGTPEWEWRAGLDDVPRMYPGRYNLPALAKGNWTDDKTFFLQVDEIGNNFQWELTLTFEGDSLTVTMVDTGGFLTEPISVQGKLAP